MSRYAANTAVGSDRSRAEIESTLRRYGASAFSYGWEADRAAIMFEAHGRRIRFVLPMPDPNDPVFVKTPSRGTLRAPAQAAAMWEQACRQSWRALALVVKAKLEAVAAGITEFEDEFLAHIVLPDGSSFGAWAKPQIAHAYELNTMPALLPGSRP